MLRSSLAVVALATTIGCRAEPGPTVAPLPVMAPTVVDLALETGWGCALRSDGGVHCWGHADPGQIVGLRPRESRWEVAGVLEGFEAIDISTSPDRLCAVQRDGSVRCLDSRDRWLAGKVVDVEVGDFVCARSSTGTVQCIDPDEPKGRIAFKGAIDLAVDGARGCGLDRSGSVRCWTMNHDEFVAHEWTRFTGATAFASFGLERDRLSQCFGRDGAIWCANGESPGKAEPMPDLAGISAFVGTPESNCAIHATGELTCAGDNRWAQVGDGTSITKPGRFEVEGIPRPTIVAKSAGYTCAATGDEVRCWGTQRIDDAPAWEQHHHDLKATGLVSDGDMTCVSTESDGVLCWGMTDILDDANYILPTHAEGIVEIARPRPIQLDLGPLKKMQGGCLLSDSGELVCDGDVEHRYSRVEDFVVDREISCRIGLHVECFDHFGGRHLRSFARFNAPRRLSRPVALATGRRRQFCAIHDHGKVSCFVVAYDGERNHVRVGTLTGMKAIAHVGRGNYAALDGQGTVWQWKFSADNSPPIQYLGIRAPTQVDELVATRDSMCRRKGSRVWCADAGPVDFEVDDIVQIAGGSDFFCVRHEDGSVTCQGHNDRGQLGVLPATVMLTPTSIEFEP